MPDNKIEIENIITAGRIERVDRMTYIAIQDTLLAIVAVNAPRLKAAGFHKSGKLAGLKTGLVLTSSRRMLACNRLSTLHARASI